MAEKYVFQPESMAMKGSVIADSFRRISWWKLGVHSGVAAGGAAVVVLGAPGGGTWSLYIGSTAATHGACTVVLALVGRVVFNLDAVSNRVYTLLRLSRSLALVVASCTGYAVVHVNRTSDAAPPAALNKAATLLALFALLRLMRRAASLELSNRFVWGSYAARIGTSVRIQAALRALYSFAKGRQPASTASLEHDEPLVHSIHKVLESNLWDVNDVYDSNVFSFIVTKLRGVAPSQAVAPSSPLPRRHSTAPPPASPVRRALGMLPRPSPMPSLTASASESFSSLTPASTSRCTLEELKRCVPDELKSALAHLIRGGRMNGTAPVIDNVPDHDYVIDGIQFGDALKRAAESRESLNRTLGDTSRMLTKLDYGLNGLMALVLLLSYSAIIDGASFKSAGTTWLTIMLALSFAFGETLKRLFEGLVLVFVWQPFIVSDRVLIVDDSNEESNLVVLRMNLLTTEFVRADGQIVIMSNSSIQASEIRNISRSSFNCTKFVIRVHASTPSSFVKSLKARVERHRVERWKDYVESVDVILRTVRDNGVTSSIQVSIQQHRNFENNAHRWEIHNSFARMLHDECASLAPVRSSLAISAES
jgi:hypothetical protein